MGDEMNAKPENPGSKGKGKGKGKVRVGVCQRQTADDGTSSYMFKSLPEPAALMMISKGKAVPAASQAECDALTVAIVAEDEEAE